jgi:hypothetical protein
LGINVTDKYKQIRVSTEAWSKLRKFAFNDEKSIKRVVDEIIIEGKRDPVTGKLL